MVELELDLRLGDRVALGAEVGDDFVDDVPVAAMEFGDMTPSPSTPEEFAKQIRFDYDRWGKVVKAAGLKVD